jgi:low temperature requirement protein LtrA
MLMVTGAVVVAVGHEIVITHPSGSTEPAWIGAILGGPMFLVGRSIFEYVVFSRVSRSRLIGTGLLVGASPAMVLVPPLTVAIVAAAVLAGIVKADARRSRRRPAEPPSPPR